LSRRLATVRRKARSVVLLTGCAQCLAGLAAAVLVYLLFDWLLDPPLAGRWAGALALVCAAGWTFLRRFTQELRLLPDDDEAALRVERLHPGLRNILISTVQLTRAQAARRYAASNELLSALQARALRAAAPLDFLAVVSRQAMARSLAACAGLLLILAVCVGRFPEQFKTLALRLVDPELSYPTRTRILEVITPPLVARGDEVRATVRVDESSVVPQEPGTLQFRDLRGGARATVDLLPTAEGRGVFRGALPQALDDLQVRARLGDARSGWHTVRVLPRPEVRGGTVQYHWPDYTGLADPPPEKLGPLTALQGSTAELAFEASQPLVRAALVDRSGARRSFAATDQAGLHWRLKDAYAITASTRFHLELADADGLSNSRPPVEYSVTAKPDAPPVIRLLRPARDATLTPRARPVLAFEARDDYGLRALWLSCRIQRAGQTEEAAARRRFELDLPGPASGPARRRIRAIPDRQIAWDLAPFQLIPGDQITFWLEADDYCTANDAPPAAAAVQEAPAGGVAHSEDVRLTVVSVEEKTLELQTRIARLFEELRGLKDEQEDLKRRVSDLIEELQKEIEANR
jgi:hypothetical protein